MTFYADQRFYTSQFAGFMSADRFQQGPDTVSSGSWNKYSYVTDDPLNLIDPTGQFGVCPVGYATDPKGKGCVSLDCPPGTVWYNGGCVAAVNDGAGKPVPSGGGPGGSSSQRDCHSIAASGGVSTGIANSFLNAIGNTPAWLSGVGNAMLLVTNWITGGGPSSVVYSPTSVQSAQMASSILLSDAISQYLKTGKSQGGEAFKLAGFIGAGIDPTQQFVGSFHYSISNSDGNLSINITNISSFTSLTAGAGPNWPRGSSPTPGGNIGQTFQLIIPCAN